MPELPEVETVKRGLAPVMEGASIVSLQLGRPDLRFPFPDNFVSRLVGNRVTSLSRRAKYLIAEMDSGTVLVMHLGMSGSFRVELEDEAQMPGIFYHSRRPASVHDHVVFSLNGPLGNAKVIYNDPRRFGFMDLVNTSELETCRHFSAMGIEPTGNALDGEVIAKLFAGKSAPLKAALLDQRLIAGLGNIYVCEALWRSGLSPRRKASTLSRKGGRATERSKRLAGHVRDVISEAIEAGGSSLRDHRQTNGELGYFQHRFSVYDREGEICRSDGCKTEIVRITQSGRSTFYCPSCQR